MTVLKHLISGFSEFQYYRDSQLWYKTDVGNFLFPVPISDVGNSTFSRVEKSILMMRYIRKYLQTLDKEMKQNNVSQHST